LKHIIIVEAVHYTYQYYFSDVLNLILYVPK
jgi:hypothetical protein